MPPYLSGMQIQVAGQSLVWVGSGTGGNLETLGYSRDGVNMRFDGYFLDVHTDDQGGDAGPPADVQWLGQSAMISLELTKWEPTIADKIVNRLFGALTPGNTQGIPKGMLMVGAGPGIAGINMSITSFVHRICIQSQINTTAFNFPYCFFREAIEINRGTKYSTFRLEAFALPVNGILYNTSTVNPVT